MSNPAVPSHQHTIRPLTSSAQEFLKYVRECCETETDPRFVTIGSAIQLQAILADYIQLKGVEGVPTPLPENPETEGAPLQEIERDEKMARDYIPLAGGYEFQTKGNGSSIRIALPNGTTCVLGWQADFVNNALEGCMRAQHERIVYLEKYCGMLKLHINSVYGKVAAMPLPVIIPEEDIMIAMCKECSTVHNPSPSDKILKLLAMGCCTVLNEHPMNIVKVDEDTGKQIHAWEYKLPHAREIFKQETQLG